MYSGCHKDRFDLVCGGLTADEFLCLCTGNVFVLKMEDPSGKP